MILVDIKVPIMGKSYDFKIDEQIPLGIVMEEVGESICQKEQCQAGGSLKELMLWDEERKTELPVDKTGYECGLKTGSQLLLV